ncbi:hypothetical protein DQ04_01051040 [Trypanosoma grayi]|uniref:hypothetical protein n=1 Tax=Trypanosoma grayi TaxID=71804 RepID=UPI0004F40A8A|nr:hypothetical protein DQ04_01051040 [Trypanosoma grayi]KEG13351.1 hypothetical protein DQ04_01051040 [Trypanosoma grayi]
MLGDIVKLTFGAVLGIMFCLLFVGDAMETNKNQNCNACSPKTELRRNTRRLSPIKKERSGMCSVCLSKQATVLFLQCRHLAACGECAAQLLRKGMHRCPICNQIYERTINVYVP